MADHFLTKTPVSQSDFVLINGQTALARYAELKTLLLERAGPEVAALFAEPLISMGNDEAPATVSWYTQFEGSAQTLSSLSAAERTKIENYLADHLQPLRALADETESAELVQAALRVSDEDFVRVVGGRPVIINWGLSPSPSSTAPSGASHFDKTVGKYLPLPGSLGNGAAGPASSLAENEINPDRLGSSGSSGPTPPPRAPNQPPKDTEGAPRPRLGTLAWLPLLILLVVSGAFLIWLLQPGSRLFPLHSQEFAVTDEAAEEAVLALNQSLRDRRDALKGALESSVCRADGTLVLPDGKTPDGLVPYSPRSNEGAPGKASDVSPDAVLPSHADRIVVPDPAGTGSAKELTKVPLVGLIEERTVLVLGVANGSLDIGSGWSVGPGHIVTNDHVVAATLDKGGEIYVVNKALKTPAAAKVVKSIGPLDQTGADFALLRIENETLPSFAVLQSGNSLKLNNVVAAGFPSDVLETDAGYSALVSGNATAMPELTLTDGTINTEQKIGANTNVLMHSAGLSSGSSGGPLVDMCGRLVGVNTFVRQGKMQNRAFALAASDVLTFLADTNAKPTIDTGDCAPTVLRPGAASDKAERPRPTARPAKE